MKRIKIAALLMMALMMTGCASARPKEPAAKPQEQQPVSQQEEQPAEKPEEQPEKTIFTAKADLGNLDETPKRFQDQGWIIKKDGLYGYVDRNGQTVVGCKYKDMQFFTGAGSSHIETCLLINDDDFDHSALLPTANPPEGAFGGGGAGQSQRYYLTDDHKVILRDYTGAMINSPDFAPASAMRICPDGTKMENEASTEYYLWLPEFDQITGPYDPDKALCLGQVGDMQDTYGLSRQELSDLLCIPAGGEEMLLNASQNKAVLGLDQGAFVDLDAIGGVIGETWYLFDENLDLIYCADIARGAAPIGSNVPIVQNGTWQLVDLGELQNASHSASKEPKIVESYFEKKNQSSLAGYQTDYDMTIRSQPDRTSAKTGNCPVGHYLLVQETNKAADGSLWGKLWDDHYICLQDAEYTYAHPVDLTCSDTETFKERFEDIIIDHYMWLEKPSGFYSCITDVQQNGPTFTCTLRYAYSDEEAKKREAAGQSVAANIAVMDVYVNVSTGAVSDSLHVDDWRIK